MAKKHEAMLPWIATGDSPQELVCSSVRAAELNFGSRRVFVIGYRSKITNATGRGIVVFTYRFCRYQCDVLNRKHPELHHFPVNKNTGE